MPMIPKLIHFIWAGGEKIMPVTAINNVTDWAMANPEFTVNIWVDPKTDPGYIDKYKKIFHEKLPKNIVFADINQEGICTPAIRYEIDGLWPNYGASSDMLRYNILFKQGGAYFDCLDVFRNQEVSLVDAEFADSDKYDAGRKVFMTELSGHRLQIHITKHSVVPGHDAPGSEAMICTPGNPSMKLLADAAQSSYEEAKWAYKQMTYALQQNTENTGGLHRAQSIDSGSKTADLFQKTPVIRRIMKTSSASSGIIADDREVVLHRARNTLELTGPGMVINILKNINTDQIDSEYIMPRDQAGNTKWVKLPNNHTLSWVAMRIVPHDYEDAIRIALDSITFEVNHMHIFNLSNHIVQVAYSVQNNVQLTEDISQLKQKIRSDLMQALTRDKKFEGLFDTMQNGDLRLHLKTTAAKQFNQ